MKREIREGQHIPLKDLDTVAAADVVCNFGSEAFVVHQEKVNFPGVADQELLEAIREEMTGLSKTGVRSYVREGLCAVKYLLVAAVADLHEVRKSAIRTDDEARTERTLGMGSWPLNRRRTRLSIPFGFRHASFTLW